MRKHLYTDEEIKILSDNAFILDIKGKSSIEYDPLFKLWAVILKIKCPYLTSKDIFELGGFDTSILNPRLPQRRIHDWHVNFNRYGMDYFTCDNPYFNISNIDIDDFLDTSEFLFLKRYIESKQKHNR